jgi:hypothetical protein
VDLYVNSKILNYYSLLLVLDTVYLILVAPTARIETNSPGEVRTREGERLEVRCEVTGYPPPTVHWYKQVSNSMSQVTG